jgi:hypothetical protein
MVHVAMFDAANAVTRTHVPFASQPAAAPGSSIDAAVATAGHGVLVALLPAHKAMLDGALAATLGKVGDAAARDGGSAVGREAAQKTLALRGGDGADAKPSYTPVAGFGKWQPTAPHNLPFGSVIWADVKPWVLRAPGEVPAPGPLAFDSAQYQREIDEVRRMGARHSKERTATRPRRRSSRRSRPGSVGRSGACRGRDARRRRRRQRAALRADEHRGQRRDDRGVVDQAPARGVAPDHGDPPRGGAGGRRELGAAAQHAAAS